MDYKVLANGFKIPVIGLGTWEIGGLMKADYSADSKAIHAIKHAIKLGYSHIDTAEIYGAGHTEELVGKSIKDFDRSNLIITSKVYNTNLKYNAVIASCKKSLEKLQTEYIDIYLIHSPNPKIPLKETMKAMDWLVEQGMVKYIGVSNFSVEQIQIAQQYSQNKIVVNQIRYNLASRNTDDIGNCKNIESEIIPYCQKNDIIVIAYRPLEGSFLLKPKTILDNLSEKYGKSKAQIAINWLVSKKNIVTIPKSINQDHLKENLDAITWDLSDEDIKLLDKTKFESQKFH